MSIGKLLNNYTDLNLLFKYHIIFVIYYPFWCYSTKLLSCFNSGRLSFFNLLTFLTFLCDMKYC
ncbi:hypothetical protein GLOIN_2v1525549, partial [Rhizophagus irregularis DAOM 181602=DAOM 197198]